MRLLLDTHALLWALADPERIATPVRQAIRDGRNQVMVSAASVWEVGIKRAAGKLEAPSDLLEACEAAGFAWLPISPAHAHAAGLLPDLHRDPFDRMLIAQAHLEALTIITRDARFAAYGVEMLPI